jgi:hypothetical protein
MSIIKRDKYNGIYSQNLYSRADKRKWTTSQWVNIDDSIKQNFI